jgi:hypothetical protein
MNSRPFHGQLHQPKDYYIAPWLSGNWDARKGTRSHAFCFDPNVSCGSEPEPLASSGTLAFAGTGHATAYALASFVLRGDPSGTELCLIDHLIARSISPDWNDVTD